MPWAYRSRLRSVPRGLRGLDQRVSQLPRLPTNQASQQKEKAMAKKGIHSLKLYRKTRGTTGLQPYLQRF
jgi:hypothetical protein